MSDLQCPATLLVSQPGDARYREQVRDLVERVKARRIAGVYCSTLTAAVQSAELAASELGLPHVVVDGLQELSDGEDEDAVVSRFRDAIEGIADVHRGEMVLVFTHGAVMASVVPRVCSNVRNDLGAQRLSPGCVPAEIDVDADGWRLLSWPASQKRREPTSSMPLRAS